MSTLRETLEKLLERRDLSEAEAGRLLVAYMPYMLHMHRVNVDLCQPWVTGFRRHPFTSRKWSWVDVDTAQDAAMRS